MLLVGIGAHAGGVDQAYVFAYVPVTVSLKYVLGYDKIWNLEAFFYLLNITDFVAKQSTINIS